MKEKHGKVPGACPARASPDPERATRPSVPSRGLSDAHSRSSKPSSDEPPFFRDHHRPSPSASPAGLAVVLVGERKDSETYVRSKKKACGEAGIASFGTDLPGDATEDEVLAVVAAYNADPDVHGILVQLPCPITSTRARPRRDRLREGRRRFHLLNIGRLPSAAVSLCSCRAPSRVHEPSSAAGSTSRGKKPPSPAAATSGTPAALLQRRDATVTIVHSRTPNPRRSSGARTSSSPRAGGWRWSRGADWPGAAVIDVGINAKDDPSKKRGYRLVGDVDYEEALSRHITPVPGGSALTIAILQKHPRGGHQGVRPRVSRG